MGERAKTLDQILAEYELATKEAATQIKTLLQDLTNHATGIGAFQRADPPRLNSPHMFKANIPGILIDTYVGRTPTGSTEHVVLTEEGTLRHVLISNSPLTQAVGFGEFLTNQEYVERGAYFIRELEMLTEEVEKNQTTSRS